MFSTLTKLYKKINKHGDELHLEINPWFCQNHYLELNFHTMRYVLRVPWDNMGKNKVYQGQFIDDNDKSDQWLVLIYKNKIIETPYEISNINKFYFNGYYLTTTTFKITFTKPFFDRKIHVFHIENGLLQDPKKHSLATNIKRFFGR